MKIFISLFLLLALSAGYSWFINKPTALCKASKTSTPYCKYYGKIDKVYLNREGLVLVYLNADFSKESAKEFGYEVGLGNVVALNVNESKSDEVLYQSIIHAMKEELTLELHARNTINGYMKIDRIWLGK